MTTIDENMAARRPDVALNPSTDAIPRRTSSNHSIALMREGGTLTARQIEARQLIPIEGPGGMTDAFREIRTRLLELNDKQNFATLVVPVSAGSGASFVARNLAMAFALDEARTALLIDCDLRRPSQHDAFGVDIERGGLIDYLEHPAVGIERIIYQTGIPRLRLIPVGKSCEMQGEFFSSFRMRAVLDSLRCRYPDRYLFLDGPPIKGAPDARIMSDLVDYVVVVAGYGRDTATAINRAVSWFDPGKLAGLVFNEAT